MHGDASSRPESPRDQPDADGIHQALLAGLLSHVGALDQREVTRPGERRAMREYLGARGARFAIFPGSGLKGKNPQFLMAGELVETSRLWARQNAAIKPEWAERIGAHLVKRTYSEPHWSKKRAAVMAYEKVTLYGVPLVADRLISYGSVDRELARELFIRHALVYGEWSTRHRFYDQNLKLLAEAEELEHRARRRGIVVDEHTLFDFYDARVGPEVVSGAHFDTWWKRERRTRPELLTFDPAMLTHDSADPVRETDFPSAWRGDSAGEPGLTFDIRYHFEPGAADDGLTIDVPVATLNRVAADDFSWNVPGLREELVTALLRSLPKQLRVNFVPAPDRAREFLAAVPPGDEPLLDALERHLRSTTGVVVPRDAWDWTRVPEHLRPTFRVVDDDGREQARGKDLEGLKAPLRPRSSPRPSPRSPRTPAGRPPGRRRGRSAPSRSRSPTPARATRSGATRRSRTRAPPWGSASSAPRTRPPPGTGSASSGCSRSRPALPEGRRPRPRPAPEACAGRHAVPHRGRAPRRPGPRRRGRRRRRAPVAAHRAGVRRAAGRGPRRARGPAPGRGARPVPRPWSPGGPRTRPCRAAPRCPRCRPSPTSRRRSPGWWPTASSARPASPGCGTTRATWRRWRPGARGWAAVRPATWPTTGSSWTRCCPLQEAYLHQVAALPPGRPPGTGLREVRWLLEEYRVSLFAQHLGTAQPVSDQRLRKALAATASPRPH